MMLLRANIKKRFLNSVAIGACAVCFVMAPTAVKASNLSPQGQWKISEFKGGNPEKDSYCALIQPYSEDIFLSLGRNILGEYSIAIDFKNGGLNPDKAYSVSLQPGPGQIRAYELMPTSPRAMVVRLGYDDSFFKTFKESKQLKAEIDGQPYMFDFPDIVGGQDKLSSCMASLKGESTTQVADIAFQAEKIEKPPVKEMVKADIPRTPVEEPKIEVKKEEVKPVEPKAKPKAEASVKPISIARVSRAVEGVNDVSVMPKAAPTPPKVSKVAETIAQTDAQKRAREALNRLKEENERLNQALKVEMNKPAQQVPDRTQEVIALKNQIDKLQSDLAVAHNSKNEIDNAAQQELSTLQSENQKLKETVQTIADQKNKVSEANKLQLAAAQEELERKSEANKLKLEAAQEELKRESEANKLKLEAAQEELKRVSEAKKLQLAAAQEELERVRTEKEKVSTPPVASKPVDENLVKQLDNLRSENARLSAALQGQEEKISQFDSRSPEAEQELREMRDRLKAMETENQKLIVDARKARGQIDTAVVDAGNQAFKKIREYEKKLEAAQADNLSLSREIEKMRRLEEDDRLKTVSGDWDLEKATKRYNEAEREIKRLGMLLEQQRVSSRQERVELEGMLFDPAVTEAAQRKKMTELEDKLANAERQLRQRGLTIPQSSGQPNLYTRATGEERVYIGAAPQSGVMPQAAPKVELAPMAPSSGVSVYTPPPRPTNNAPRRPAVSSSVETAGVSPRVSPSVPTVRSTSLSFGPSNVQTLLNRAGVSAGAISAGSNNEFVWRNGNVQGSAFTSQARSINDFANQYIAQQRQSCSGDFASLPSDGSNAQAVGFDIACVGASDNKAASLVFTRQGNKMVAIAHESTADDMDSVIDIRDRILSSL